MFGELGLTGEVRPVAHGEERLRELMKLGYTRVILPRDNLPYPAGSGFAATGHQPRRGAGRGFHRTLKALQPFKSRQAVVLSVAGVARTRTVRMALSTICRTSKS